jgi:hypothetical protein
MYEMQGAHRSLSEDERQAANQMLQVWRAFGTTGFSVGDSIQGFRLLSD